MTVQPAGATSFRAPRVLLGALLGLAGHALAFGLALVAVQLVEPSAGGGFEDIGAAVLTYLGVELLVALACLIGGPILMARRRWDLGVGLLAGWVLGAIASWLIIQAG